MTTEAMHPESVAPNKRDKLLKGIKDFFVHVLAQIRILKRAYPGIMHVLIFWGMTLLIIGHAITLMQMALFVPFVELTFPRENLYLTFEFISDIAGLMVLTGLLLAAFRRFVLRPKYLQTQWDDAYVLIMIGIIPILGYINEGTRIIAAQPDWAASSPVGNLFASVMSGFGLTSTGAASIHSALVWTHLIFGLVLIGSIPFTKLRHLVFTPINILLRTDRRAGVLEKIEDIENAEILGVGNIEEFTSMQLLSFDACTTCGRCEDACPVTISGMTYSPKDVIQAFRNAMHATLVAGSNPNGETQELFAGETAWACTTCGLCLSVCPAFVNPIDEIIDIRRYQVLTTGGMPKSVGDTLRNMERQGNPWGIPPQDRLKWAEGLDVNLIQPGQETDVLLFLGCSLAFDERNKKIARAIVKLFEQKGIDYAILGIDEGCCGETARRLGHEYVFQVMAEQNIEILNEVKFNKIVTQCPHCFNTIKNEYPQFGGNFEIEHLATYLAKLPAEGASSTNARITYHDPCYLGRYNDEYDSPRELLDRAGFERIEMTQCKANSFCCGGGGGQMWLETDAETRVNHQRLNQTLDTGVDTVITACPYCLTMYEDAINSKGLGEQIKVLDLAEVLAEGSKAEN